MIQPKSVTETSCEGHHCFSFQDCEGPLSPLSQGWEESGRERSCAPKKETNTEEGQAESGIRKLSECISSEPKSNLPNAFVPGLSCNISQQ